ncbi:MAG: AMP-binding protein, partial [bacterium]|nr:AMP-binding protein [bacterium]
PLRCSPKEVTGEFVRPFSISGAPLIRVGLIKEKEEQHILMVDIHHIVSDGLSHSILLREFMAFYEENELPILELQYKDYSQWQNSETQKEAVKRQKEYWLERFAGEIPVLNMQLDYPRPSVQNFEGNQIDFEMDNEKVKALNDMAVNENTTLYTVILAVFNILLAKISGREDIVIGTPVAGRRHTELEQIIGMFVNTLALRSYPGGGDTFGNFLQQVKENTLNAFENQDYPFEELVDRVSVNRDVSRNPLFDVMFVLQNMEFPKIEIPGLKLLPYKYENRMSKFDMTLWTWEDQGHLSFTVEYCTKLFKRETIERFVFFFKQIVFSILSDPGKKISEIEMMSGEEKKKILFDFNGTEVGYLENKTIHELFEEQVERTPDHVALAGQSAACGTQYEDEAYSMHCVLTYNELNEKSNRLAHLLHTKNVKPDTIVGIMMERSVEMIIGILGILKAGSAYLPIDPHYPGERINYMLTDSGAKALVTTRPVFEDRKIGRWDDMKNLEIVFPDSYTLLPFPPSTPPSFLPHPTLAPAACLAYVIYTSGSTGKPKGVMIPHGSLVNFIKGITDVIPFGGGDRILSLTTVCFDIFVLETLLPLTRGAKVLLGTEDEQVTPALMASILKREGVTIFQVTPSRLQLLVTDED